MMGYSGKERGYSLSYGLEDAVITPEYVLRNTVVEDITDNMSLLGSSRQIVAETYKGLSNKDLSLQDVYEDICVDGYDNNGRSRTIATVIMDRPEGKIVSGTVRIVLGGEGGDGLKPLDAMNLLDIPDWFHRDEGISDTEIGELGRFVIPNFFRTKTMESLGIPNLITRQLYDKALQRGRELAGIKRLYAIMPAHVVERVKKAGIGVLKVEGVTMRKEDPWACEIFEKYDVYWGKLNPAFYLFTSY